MTVTEDRQTTEVGSSRLRKEDARLITGRTRWTDNITLPGMLHLAMVRSPVAHGKITSIDVDAAKASPGVIAVSPAPTSTTNRAACRAPGRSPRTKGSVAPADGGRHCELRR